MENCYLMEEFCAELVLTGKLPKEAFSYTNALLNAVVSVCPFLVSVILVPWSHKAPGTSENQAQNTTTQSLTLSQTHLLLALEFIKGTLKMEMATGCGKPTVPEHVLIGFCCKYLICSTSGGNWIDPGSVWRGTEENQHWDGAHHRATSPFSWWTNNWPWCQHSQCSPHPSEEVRVCSSGLCCNLIVNSSVKKECSYDWVVIVPL